MMVMLMMIKYFALETLNRAINFVASDSYFAEGQAISGRLGHHRLFVFIHGLDSRSLPDRLEDCLEDSLGRLQCTRSIAKFQQSIQSDIQ